MNKSCVWEWRMFDNFSLAAHLPLYSRALSRRTWARYMWDPGTAILINVQVTGLSELN